MPTNTSRDTSDKPSTPAVAHQPGANHEPQAAVLTVGQVVEATFQRFDANNDGVITADELAIEVDPSGRFPDLVTHLAAALTTVDGNADGGVSKEELTAAVKQVDSNGDGTLGRSELSQAHQDDSPVTALIDARPIHDGPGDGKPDNDPHGKSVSELIDQLFTLDSNNDTLISLSELLTLATSTALSTAPVTGTDSSSSTGTVLVIDAGQGAPHGGAGGHAIDFTALLTEVFTAIDTNKDAFLSRDEVSAAFNALDTNHDGQIDHADQPLANWDQQSIELIGLLVHDQVHGDHGAGG